MPEPTRISATDLRVKLAILLARIALSGDRFIIYKNNSPIAMLVPPDMAHADTLGELSAKQKRKFLRRLEQAL
ncbi:MAG: hypothetical protein A2741_02990 [Candidatus Zambryskibacteria bacterium RIFCSPHIGHO2_01_FULL_43_27]|uniref:Antitoxin n=1 Tax=Candidatus Zambryskibacteria bacterium RIFCSPLOWO2_01_FULL_43_17 TaxID=1802760 RepID=A0A1G2U5R3_9BACT|nr:MAG: hypothetical protein A2741_02990 [Candidatus Zambryskibacteria bacterium RIFCSPHIGHO2_01_FULL_43_27]OHA99409.1 MAG: hypothetical protein A3E93_00065 [Candidatus Zambryskibacteria bacterium RIFCSPHIGHO2_12_FULL_43_12b]OHB04833.1 MAG: hypothetical protein A2920_00575 [Candidatus Zambryskibacteria bacterium RIFCSPLOWO2_01_FULL_43_17]